MKTKALLTSFALLAGNMATAAPASANDDAPSSATRTTGETRLDPDWQDRQIGPDTPLSAWRKLLGTDFTTSIGVGVYQGPEYAGGRETSVYPAPFVSVERGALFLDSTRGLGIQFVTVSDIYISQSIGYDFGRGERLGTFRPGSKRLRGMGEVEGSVMSNTLIAKQFTPWLMGSLEANVALKDHVNRTRAKLDLEVGLVRREKDGLVVNADVLWGNRAYNQDYFGVTVQQAVATGRSAFTAKDGVYGYMLGTTWEHTWSPSWKTSLNLAATRYAGRVEKSSVVEKRTSVSTTAALIYEF